ncbi:HAD family phosphatase [uncultured Roseibium sp.]|uniref:HAD family hydrolase n=1 Tax=uncultured Roseibium sp. TaxID=1936171 RepID=UPI0026333803|nr:HAD family phosphatase [uncultured Roseibium sp.]
MADIKAVIFDLDGCLVDSEPLSLAAVAAEMRATGLWETTVDEVREKYLGVSIQKIRADVAERLRRPCPEDFGDRIEVRLFDLYNTGLRRIEGARDLLTTLSGLGIPVAIATGGSVKRMRKTLDLAGLETHFKARAFSADQVRHGKPAPDLFLLAAKRLGVVPAHCAVLEDSPHGIAGAAAAGMRPIGFVGGSHLDGRRTEHASRLYSAGAVQVVDNLSKALEALLSIDAQALHHNRIPVNSSIQPD